MNPVLKDLLEHQLWADAESWRMLGSHAAATEDNAIRERLFHMHLVQRAFMWIVRADGMPFAPPKPGELSSFGDLRSFARGSHAEVQQVLDTISEERLAESIQVPWFKDPPLSITVSEALTQSAMHTQHHRGQNAARLRELGGTPEPTDLIVWYWKGRPKAEWPV